MELFYSKIVGIPVLADSLRPLAFIEDIVVDPENGKVLAIVTNKSKNNIVSHLDIVKLAPIFVKINHINSIISSEEIIRVNDTLNDGFYIQNCRIESKNGEFLGRVFDFSLDPNLMVIKKIHAAKGFLSMFRYAKRIFGIHDIHEILPGKIIVKEIVNKEEIGELQSSPGVI